MMPVLQTLFKYNARIGTLLFLILGYGLLTGIFSINFQNFKTLFFRKISKTVVDFEGPNDPDVALATRLLGLTEFGCNGSAVKLDLSKLPIEEVSKFNRSLESRNYSSYTSSLISLQRHLPDIRPKECGKVYSNLTLPKVSVVIIFHNEHWSTLLRTTHSVLDNSPVHLVQEVVLMDDASTDDDLKEPLNDYVARTFTKVTVVRAKTKQGLIRARNLGFEATSAPVVVFLDSHCECFPGWLEPLVARIAENETIVTTPSIHTIHRKTFEIIIWESGDKLAVPVITIPNLFFQWIRIYPRELQRRKHPTDPVRAPAMVGCIIAISRMWFQKLGMFDPGLEWWGGENTELSLKTWLCGAGLEIIPCSNVAHMYFPHAFTKERRILFNRNILRVAAVWLDRYKVFAQGYSETAVDPKEIEDRVAIREALKCHTFDYYLTHVHPELHIPGDGIFTGEIRSSVSPFCMDFGSSERKDEIPVILYVCHGHHGNQNWDYTDFREIRVHNFCLYPGQNLEVLLKQCQNRNTAMYQWRVDRVDEDGHVQIKTKEQCVGADIENRKLLLEQCSTSRSQLWFWKKNREPRIPD